MWGKARTGGTAQNGNSTLTARHSHRLTSGGKADVIVSLWLRLFSAAYQVLKFLFF